MNKDQFVDALVMVVRNASINDVIGILENPPGRKPTDRSISLTSWYSKLSEEDKRNLKYVVADSVDASIFGLLCVLDGVRVIEQGYLDNRLKLIHAGTLEYELNSSVDEPLHDIYSRKIRDI